MRYFSSEIKIKLPFTASGNSHNFDGKVLNGIQGWRDYLNSQDVYDIVRLHPKILEIESVSKNLTELLSNGNRVIMPYFDQDSFALNINNKFEKVFADGWLSHNESMLAKNLLYWGKEKISEMSIWEVREFLSLYIYPQHLSEIELDSIMNFTHPNLYKFNIEMLFSDFENTIKSILKFASLPIKQFDFNEVYEKWVILQKHKDKDALITKIVNSVLDEEDYEWGQLTIVDEAIIQMKLRDLHKLDLKCYNLNVFPKNTLDLKKLLFNDESI